MYLARFATGDTELVTAAITWTMSSRPLLPPLWLRHVAELVDVDVANLIHAGSAKNQAVLLLSADSVREEKLRTTVGALLQIDSRPDLVVPAGPSEFDAITGLLPEHQLCVNHEGYHHLGFPLACDFRLYPIL